MSYRTLAVLGLSVIGLVLADRLLTGGEAGLFLAKKLLDLVEYLVFWR
jgi:hypothetical protein